MNDPLAADLDHFLDHVESPYHRGLLDQPTHVRTERNAVCGDQISLQLEITDGRILQAYFDGRGCTISQAAASILCEFVEGKPVALALNLRAEEMLELLHAPLTPMRQRCALLAFRALKAILYSFGQDELRGRE